MTTSRERLHRASLLSGVRVLARRDRKLAALVARNGPPPLWARRPGFATLLRIILEQQVSLASGQAMYLRIAGAVGAVEPASILILGVTELRRLGVTRQKAAYISDLAERVDSGQLPLHRLGICTDAEASERLMQVRGIGPWTAGIYLLMVLRRPDIWPPGDLALNKALGRLHGTTSMLSVAEVERLTGRWRPLRAVAARILWHGYLQELRARAHA